MDKVNNLEKVELFREVEVLQELKKINFKVLKFEKDDYIAFRGQKVEGVYINISGSVVTEMLRENGESKKIEELRPGSILASAFVFGENNRFPVDLVAKSKTQILFIEKKEFLKLISSNEKILSSFLDEISNKAQFLSKNLWESVSKKSIQQKLALYLLEHQKDGIVELRGTINELAEYFNVTRPSLSRVIKQFSEEEIIEKLKKGVYEIKNFDHLKSL